MQARHNPENTRYFPLSGRTQSVYFALILGGLTAINSGITLAADGQGEIPVTPTAIAEVNALAQVKISCPDDAPDCNFPECTVTNPTGYMVEGQLQTAPGVFESSYDSKGFSLTDGTGGIFILSDEELSLKREDWVQVTGTTSCRFGTLALNDSVVLEVPSKSPVVFAPRQIGQLTARPEIQGNPDVTPNWCDCLMPFSATEGQVITVRGTAVADLEDDGSFGYKLFLDDGSGVAQIFIDASSYVSVQTIRSSLLIKGADLCVSGVVAHFAGVGYELLPRNDKDIRLARPYHKDPCKSF